MLVSIFFTASIRLSIFSRTDDIEVSEFPPDGAEHDPPLLLSEVELSDEAGPLDKQSI